MTVFQSAFEVSSGTLPGSYDFPGDTGLGDVLHDDRSAAILVVTHPKTQVAIFFDKPNVVLGVRKLFIEVDKVDCHCISC